MRSTWSLLVALLGGAVAVGMVLMSPGAGAGAGAGACGGGVRECAQACPAGVSLHADERGEPGFGGVGSPVLTGLARRPLSRCAPAVPLITRTYEVPRLPEGWLWKVTWSPGQPGAQAPCCFGPSAIESQVLRRLGEPDPWGVQPQMRYDAARGLVLTGSDQHHERLRQLLTHSDWAPRWGGAWLAAREILAIECDGSAAERAWARDARFRAGAEIEEALEWDREQERRFKDVFWRAPEPEQRAVCAPEPACRVRVWHVHHESGIMRGVGVRSGSLQLAEPLSMGRSVQTFLDDTQFEVLTRAIEKDGLACPTAEQVVELVVGQTAEVLFVGGARLVLTRQSLGSDAGRSKFVGLQYRLRVASAQGLVFAPSRFDSLPVGGSLLLAPGDTLLPDDRAAPGLHVIVSVDVPDPAADEPVERTRPAEFAQVPERIAPR